MPRPYLLFNVAVYLRRSTVSVPICSILLKLADSIECLAFLKLGNLNFSQTKSTGKFHLPSGEKLRKFSIIDANGVRRRKC